MGSKFTKARDNTSEKRELRVKRIRAKGKLWKAKLLFQLIRNGARRISLSLSLSSERETDERCVPLTAHSQNRISTITAFFLSFFLVDTW